MLKYVYKHLSNAANQQLVHVEQGKGITTMSKVGVLLTATRLN